MCVIVKKKKKGYRGSWDDLLKFFCVKTILEFGLLPFKKFIEKLRLQTNDTLCGLVGDALSIYFFKKK